jgi:tetraacyldisaccharide 4'-kinase
MREPSFWWAKPGLAALLLAPLAAGYGAIAAARMRKRGGTVDIPVICVGNFTLGGAGKTPTALAAARIMGEAGERPFFLSRGYGGRLAGPVLVDPHRHAAGDVGDEPLLLARAAPAIVARDRYEGARLAQAEGASVIVMDDGLQNASLEKDLTIAVVDARRGIGNGKVFPAGPLRAPLPAQLARADAILFVGDADGAAPPAPLSAPATPHFHASLLPDEAVVDALRGKPLLAYAGIGDPRKFFATLTAAGLDVRLRQAFPDHHRIRPEEAQNLAEQARTSGLFGVTTEKDWARMAGDEFTSTLREISTALPVRLAVAREGRFREFLLRAVGKR